MTCMVGGQQMSHILYFGFVFLQSNNGKFPKCPLNGEVKNSTPDGGAVWVQE